MFRGEVIHLSAIFVYITYSLKDLQKGGES